MLPLLFRSLNRLGMAGVPAPVVAELAVAYRANSIRNALFAHELTRILTVLGKAGIPVIPLKGVALAESLYGDMTLRVCSDLDILVPRSMAKRALVGLGAMDYRAEFTGRFFIEFLLCHDIECALVRRRRGIEHSVDLHWGIAWGGSRDELATNELWAAARRTRFRGIPACALSPEWELLFLALHAARHRWQGLKWLADIHELCVRDGIDWSLVREKAGRFGWGRVLHITLAVSRFLLNTPVPAEFAGGPLPTWLKTFPADPEPPGNWRDALFPIRLFSRPSERLRHLARLLLVPTLADHRLVRLPSYLGPLYYPLRPVRLGGKWLWHAVRASAGRVVSARAARE